MMQSTAKSRRRIPSKGDRDGALVWIRGALDIIARDGVKAVKIEKLAREIGVSKGSFYWFFLDLDDLLTRSLDHWRHDYNNAIFDQIRCAEGDIETRLNLLLDTVFRRELGRYDAAIRAWALQDVRAHNCMAEVDSERVELLIAMFADGRSPDAEDELRAHMFYRALIAESYISTYPTGLNRLTYMRALVTRLKAENNPVKV